MSSALVLGHPYQGAFYWLLNAESWRQSELKSVPVESHGYYRTLYGSAPNKIIDKMASMCLLYDEIILAPVDAPLPEQESYMTGSLYMNSELGIRTDWAWSPREEYAFREEQIRFVASDLVVQRILARLPHYSTLQVIRHAILQIEIRDRFKADFMCDSLHQRLYDRIRTILGMDPATSDNKSAVMMNALKLSFDVASIQFSLESLRDYTALRTSNSVRKYAASFKSSLDEMAHGEDAEQSFFEAMAEAMDQSELRDKVSGGLGVGASLTGPVSLIPIIGTIAGAVGMGMDVAARGASRSADATRWWSLAPEVSKVLTMGRIRERAGGRHRAR